MENSDTNGSYKLWETINTPKNSDCVSFCKVPGFEHLLLCANYQLDSQTQNTFRWAHTFLTHHKSKLTKYSPNNSPAHSSQY